MENQEKDAARLVSAEVLGFNIRTVIVGGKAYVIKPPTIAKLMGATYHLTEIKEAETLSQLLRSLGQMDSLCKALSCLITEDESLALEFQEGTLDEVVSALETAFDLIDIKNFTRLSTLVRSARMLTAKQRL